MGLWNWITGKRQNDQPPSDPTHQRESASGVATLEPPAESTETAPAWWAPEGVSFTELQPVARPEMCLEAKALENTLFSQFDGHDLELPPLPRVPEQVLRELGQTNCDFGRLANVIAEDQVIAAAVLRMVNSPYYRGTDKITSLRNAVARLGTKSMRALMLNQSMRAATTGGKEGDQILAETVWRRSLAGAAVLRGLAGLVGWDEEEAFLLGLLHDIGNVVVLREVRRQHRHVGVQIGFPTFEYLCYECHQEFGELIADAWSLPTELRGLIADHHEYPSDDNPLRKQRLLIHMTDMICALLGYAPETCYDLRASRAAEALDLSDRPDFISFLSKLREDVCETVSSL